MEFIAHAFIDGMPKPITFMLENGEECATPQADALQALSFIDDVKAGIAVFDLDHNAWILTPDSKVTAIKVVQS